MRSKKTIAICIMSRFSPSAIFTAAMELLLQFLLLFRSCYCYCLRICEARSQISWVVFNTQIKPSVQPKCVSVKMSMELCSVNNRCRWKRVRKIGCIVHFWINFLLLNGDRYFSSLLLHSLCLFCIMRSPKIAQVVCVQNRTFHNSVDDINYAVLFCVNVKI